MFYRNKQFLVALLLTLVWAFNPLTLKAVGTPHLVFGTVQYSNGSHPGSLTFSANISGRSGETLSQSSSDCGYDETSGSWWVQCANFPTSWADGDHFNISFNDGAGGTGSDGLTLDNQSPYEDAGTTTLSQPSKQITITTNPSGLNISVDGSSYTTPHTFSWNTGSTHTLSVSSPQSGGSGIRYNYSSWSDGGAQSHSYTVPGSNQTVTANFQTQYELTVTSSHGSPTGAGWYNAGSSATFGVTSPEGGGSGTRYVFTSWAGSGSGSYTGSSISHSVTMNNPVTETASWKTQYQLIVNSSYGSPTGAGWYDAGTSATFGVTSPVSGGSGTRYALDHWSGSGSGSYSGSSVSSTITMNNPVTETANWNTQYYLSTAENPSAGGDITPSTPGQWYNSGSVVSANATTNSGYQWAGFSGDLSGTARPQNITMNSPKSVTANFGQQVLITINTNPSGRSVTVDGTTYSSTQTFDWVVNSVHSVSVSSPQSGGSGIRYNYSSWSDGGAQSHSYTVPGSNQTVTANFQTQYELTVTSSHGSPTGAGWYNAGSSATFGVTSPESGGSGTRYVFTSWAGSGSGSYTGSSASHTVTMNNPLTETASWKTQYQLIVNSSYGSPTGAGWYDAGASATFGVTSPVSGGSGTRYLFGTWTGSGSGSYSGSSVSSTITMNNPVTESAGWNTQYYLTTAENPSAGGDITPSAPGQWYNSGSVVSVNATTNSGYQWAGFSGDLSGATRPQNITMNGPKSVTASFGKQVQITITASPSGRSFTVDGTSYTSVQTFTWIENSVHTLSTTSPQDGGSGVRYNFSSWSNGGVQSHSYTIPGSNQTVTVNFQLQYNLTLNSSHGSPKGEGWRNAGSTANFSVTSPDVQGDTRYMFHDWSGDYTGGNPYGSVLMDGPKTVNASWNTQHRLDIQSDYGNPQGEGWYGEGTTAHFSVSTPDVRGNTRYVFRRYEDDFTGTSSSGSIIMNESKNIQVRWNTEYYLFMNKNPNAGGNVSPETPGKWCREGEVVTIEAAPNSANNYVFSGWTGDLNGTVNPGNLTMDQSKSITANFNFNGQIRITTQPEGLKVIVDDAEYTSPHDFMWSTGSVHKISSPSVQRNGEKTEHRFAAWSDVGAQTHQITVTNISLYTANFNTYFYLDIAANPDIGGIVNPASPGLWLKKDSVISVKAVPSANTGFVFQGWNGNIGGSENPAELLMNAPKQVTANFVLGTCQLTTDALPAGHGEVVILPKKDIYTHGDKVTLIALPKEGFAFTNWSGSLETASDTLNLTMNQDYHLIAHFSVDDQLSPVLSACYPKNGTLDVPINTRIQFRIEDPQPGTGIDLYSFNLSINGNAVFIDGKNQGNGQLLVDDRESYCQFTYLPGHPFKENSQVNVLVQCLDLAYPPNLLYKKIAFKTGISTISEQGSIHIGPDGGSFTLDATGLIIIVPEGAVSDTTELIVSLCDSLPDYPDGHPGFGIKLHLWPEAFEFEDSVTIGIPCTQADLDAIGIANPMKVAVNYFSTRTGEWIQLLPFDADASHLYIHIKELCYFTLSNVNIASDVEKANALPNEFRLSQNFPNPFNPSTTIAYEIPSSDQVSLAVYNMQGQCVRTLVNETQTPGFYQVIWNGDDDTGRSVSSGVYVLMLNSQNQRKIVKAMFMK